MIEKLRKLLCYTLIFTLFNTSFQPIYAFPGLDDDVKGASTHSRKMIVAGLETPQVAEPDGVSSFFKTLWGVTKSVMRRSLKPLALLTIVAHHTRGVNAGDEFQVNQNGTGDQDDPSVASLPDRNIFWGWQGNQAGNYDIYGRISFPNGTPIGNEFMINQNMIGAQCCASYAILTNDDLFIIWNSDHTGSLEIYGRIFSSNGTAISNEFPVNQNTAGIQQLPFVKGLSNGNALTIWSSYHTGNNNLYGRIFSPNGVPIGNEFPINQNTTGPFYTPSIARLMVNAFVGWDCNYAGTQDLYGRILSPDGTPIGNEFPINQNMTRTQGTPSVITLNNDNTFWAWRSDQTGDYDIYGRIFFPDGVPIGNEFPINENTTGFQTVPSIALLPNGDVIVVWGGNQAGTLDIYGRLFSPWGTPRGPEVRVNQNTTADQDYPSTSSLPNGDMIVTWAGNQAGTRDIYGRVLDAATLSSYLYPAPAPAPLPSPLPASVPSPKPAPAPIAFALLSAPASELAPSPVPSPILTPSLFTQPSSETNSLSFSELSTYMLTPSSSSLPFSSSTVLWDSSSSLLEPSTTSPSGRTAAIIGGAAGGAAFLIITVVVFILVKVFCFSGGDKKEAPDSSPVDEEDVEEKEESSSSSLTGPDRMTLTNVTEKVTGKLSDKQRTEQYVDFSGMSKVVDEDDDRGYQYVELSSLSPSAQVE